MYVQVGDFGISRRPPTVPLMQILRTTLFLSPKIHQRRDLLKRLACNWYRPGSLGPSVYFFHYIYACSISFSTLQKIQAPKYSIFKILNLMIFIKLYLREFLTYFPFFFFVVVFKVFLIKFCGGLFLWNKIWYLGWFRPNWQINVRELLVLFKTM